ncbi:MAG: nucleotidyltransferase domain-containing protein [Ignavibacteriales bacterium]|nr:nucleotidyltransferase domain-containing protein [Ignavibacteriales bacterium]
MVESSIINIVKKYKDQLNKKGVEVNKILLYGSYAKHVNSKESDIDVAVISDNFGIDPIDEGMMLFRIAGEIDLRIEPVAFSRKSFEEDNWLPLIYEIKKTGIEVN